MTGRVRRRLGPGRICQAAVAGAVLLFLIAPLVVVVVSAFNAGAVVAFPPQGWSLRWFAAAWQRQDFIAALGTSLWLGVLVTAISLVPGFATALALVRARFPGRRVLAALVLSPLLVPHVVIGFAMLSVMAEVHLLGTLTAVVIAYVVIAMPLVVRSLVATLQGIDEAIEQAAMVFGAGRLRALWLTTIPLALRGISAAAIFSLVVVLDEAVIINFIGSVHTVTFPMRLLSYVSATYDPIASVYATVMIAGTLLLMLGLDRLVGLERMSAGFTAK